MGLVSFLFSNTLAFMKYLCRTTTSFLWSATILVTLFGTENEISNRLE